MRKIINGKITMIPITKTKIKRSHIKKIIKKVPKTGTEQHYPNLMYIQYPSQNGYRTSGYCNFIFPSVYFCIYTIISHLNILSLILFHKLRRVPLLYIYIYIYIYHHHHVVLVAWISLTLSRHFFLSFIASGRSSGQHPVSSHSCWMYVRAGRPAFVRPCVGVHKSTSLMSLSLLLQQCPACLVRLTWIVFVIGGRWPYSWCLFLRCCHQDLFNIYIYI